MGRPFLFLFFLGGVGERKKRSRGMHLQFSWGGGGIGRRRRRRETIKSQFLCRHGETGLISENKRIHVGRRRENKYSLGFFLPLSLPPLKSFTYFLLAVAKEIKACNISPPNRCTSGCVANYLCTAYVLMFVWLSTSHTTSQIFMSTWWWEMEGQKY